MFPPKVRIRLFFWSLVFILLICTFFRIEYWPFSDYRVFEQKNHPSRIAAYRLGFDKGNGEIEWAIDGEDNKHLYGMLLHLHLQGPDKVRNFISGNLHRLDDRFRRTYDELILYQHQLLPRDDGTYSIKSVPYLRFPL